MRDLTAVSVGETLWDVLPTGTHLGGAPFNVAAHLARFGVNSMLITRVGDDELGRAAIRRGAELGVETRLIQVDPVLPTGRAHVVADESGLARFEFTTPAAWDAIEVTPPALAAVAQADIVIFGTLAQRGAAARSALANLLRGARRRLFDPNLREPHVDRGLCLSLLSRAHMIKFSEEEATRFAEWLGCADDARSLLHAIAGRHGAPTLCITRGERGAQLYHDGAWTEHAGFPAEAVDTVGAGDAFLALLTAQLLRHEPADAALRRAARLAAFVVSRPGAVPDYDPAHFGD